MVTTWSQWAIHQHGDIMVSMGGGAFMLIDEPARGRVSSMVIDGPVRGGGCYCSRQLALGKNTVRWIPSYSTARRNYVRPSRGTQLPSMLEQMSRIVSIFGYNVPKMYPTMFWSITLILSAVYYKNDT